MEALAVEAREDAVVRDPGGVQSLERAFAILDAIARNEGIRLVDISRQLDLHSSTTFHLLSTMMSLGYIEQMTNSKGYRIGRRLFTLAAANLDEQELMSFVEPALHELTAATGEGSHFAVRSGGNAVILGRTSGNGALQIADHISMLRPPHCTALGKVVLSDLGPRQFRRFLETADLRAFTPRTITDPALLETEIEQVRRNGIAFDDGEFNTELRCVAAPVHNFTGRIIGALGISGPIWHLSITSLQEKSKLVLEAASRLSRELGFQS